MPVDTDTLHFLRHIAYFYASQGHAEEAIEAYERMSAEDSAYLLDVGEAHEAQGILDRAE